MPARNQDKRPPKPTQNPNPSPHRNTGTGGARDMKKAQQRNPSNPPVYTPENNPGQGNQTPVSGTYYQPPSQPGQGPYNNSRLQQMLQGQPGQAGFQPSNPPQQVNTNMLSAATGRGQGNAAPGTEGYYYWLLNERRKRGY